MVAPKNHTVISLEPEFIIPQDGNVKQDCEHEAMKRWLKKHNADSRSLGVTVLGDDLYCLKPMCLAIQDAGFNFILVCLPESHKTLYEWVDFLATGGKKQSYINRRGLVQESETDTYRFVNDVPIRFGADALTVNWCEIITTKAV